jgi:hypothetical protein
MDKEQEAKDRWIAEQKADTRSPEETPYFVIVNDRYYLGMWFLHFPEALCKYGAKRGDITVMVHRKLDTLTDWMMKLRFRYYLGPNPNDPYSVHDKKDWHGFIVHGKSEPEMELGVRDLLRGMITGGQIIAGGPIRIDPPDMLALRCQGDQCMEVMRTANKSWLHMKTGEQLEKDKWFTKREQADRETQAAKTVEEKKPGTG